MSDIKYKVQRQHMIESTETNSFIDKIYKLVAENLSNTKGMDVIMLLGGTGNGKSTILNMIAANEITCSRAKGKWIFNSNPSVAMIGHGVSTTFQPNYWEGNGLRIYDCPGFNDTRSLQYEISKSFFIKEIADNAKSFKIILVGDIHSVHGGRCGPFMEYINQLKGFIHNFNESKDYSIVITKAQSDLIPQDITDEFKQCLKVEISPAKATLIYQPEKAGIYDYSKISFKAIFQAAPSISSKCSLPLSAEAKLKLAQISKQLNNSIIKAVKAFVFAARIHYLQVIASKIETDKTSFKKIFETFQQIDIFKGSSNPEDFIKKLQQYCLKLDKLCQVRFEFSYLLKFISKKINQIQFLKKKIESFEICVNNWVQCIQFNCQQFNRSNSAETMQDINSFSLFLRASANIDVDKSIEQQAHQYLVTQQIIPTKYSGSKQVTFYLQKNDKCDKILDKSCVIKEVFQKNIQYQGSVYFQDSKRVTGKVSVESCSCGNFLVNRCLACSHFTKYLDYSLSVSCSGYENYKGEVYHRQQEFIDENIKIELKKDFQVKKNCNQTVKYDGQHDAVCQDHHRCSCANLAKIVFSAKDLVKDILCYNAIMFAQQKQISTLKNTSFPQIMANPYLPIEEFDFESEKIFQHQFTLKEITDKIHDQLTQRFYFTFPYSGSIHVKVERPYCQKISFKGVEYIRRTINHNAKVPYKGYVNYKRNQDYNGSVQAHTCYFTCRWCNDSIYNKSFSGTEYFSGNVQYYGTKYYQETRPVMKQIVYDEEVPCAGTIEHSQWVQYNGESKACCQKGNSLGQGHHDCTSCKTWDKFVNAFKKLIEIKAKIIGNVQKNMKTLTNLAKPPREIIQA